MKNERTVIIAGGGTGGHLFPGMALAEAFASEGHEPVFVGTQRGIEARVIPDTGWRLHFLPIRGLKGTGLRAVGRFFLIPAALWRSMSILRKERPCCVVGVGGYASGPLVLTASMMGIPTFVLEQNSVPGITNRILGRVVKRVFINFDEARSFFPERKVVTLGNPIRHDIVAKLSSLPPATGRNLLIIGGSQGALGLNRAMAEAAPFLRESGISVLHQTGGKENEKLRRAYSEAGIDFRIVDFITDMAEAYAWSSVIVARAGATTLSELAIVGRPAILVPFPYATDDHQRKNAMQFVDAGAAEMMLEDSITGETLASAILGIMDDPDRHRTMSEAMRSLARPRAAEEIRDHILGLVK